MILAQVTPSGGSAVRLARPPDAAALEAHALLREVSDWSERAAQPLLGEAGESPQVLLTLDNTADAAVRLLGIPLDAVALVEREGLRVSGRVTRVEMAPGTLVLLIEP